MSLQLGEKTKKNPSPNEDPDSHLIKFLFFFFKSVPILGSRKWENVLLFIVFANFSALGKPPVL